MSPRGAGFALCLLLRLVLAAEEEEDGEEGKKDEEASPLEKYIRRSHSGTQTPTTSGSRRWKTLVPAHTMILKLRQRLWLG